MKRQRQVWLEVHVRNALEELRVQTPGGQFFFLTDITMAKDTKTSATKTKAKTASITKKVAAMAATLKKLNAVSYDKVTLAMGTAVQNVSNPYYVYNITNGLNTWGAIFGSDSNDLANVQKMYVNSYKFDARLVQANEPDRTLYTAFIVSLKDQANDTQTWLNSSTGALVLTPGVHYQTLSGDGKVLMNKKYFNIHSYKRFAMGGRVGDQSVPDTRDLSFTIRPKQRLIENPGGNIFGSISGRNGLPYPRDPSQNYFFILFNDNSALDFQDNIISLGGLAQVAIPS